MKRLVLVLAITLLALITVGCAPRIQVTSEKTIQGTPGSPGTPGNDGRDGLDGSNGRDGANGTDGRDGVDGEDGDSVTMVRFCAGQTTVYPTSFPEYGFCIGGVLYGTYWDGHQAWTAQIAPGAYRSTATGLGCNFTVTSNCGVQ